jgi:hypothetical protein
LVKEGEQVEKGQKLILLEDKDSAELDAAREKLDALELDYQKSLLAVGVDYTLDYLDIKNQEEDLDRARGELANISSYQAAYEKAADAAAVQKENVRVLQREYDAFGDALTALAADDFFLLSPEFKTPLEAAAQKLKSAETAKKKADDAVAEYEKILSSSPTGGNLAEMRRAVERQEARIASLRLDYGLALTEGTDTQSILQAIREAEQELGFLREDYASAMAQASAHSTHEARLRSALRTQKTANGKADAAKEELEKAKSETRASLATSQKVTGAKLETAKDSLAKADEDEAAAQAKASLTVEEANHNIRELERALANKTAALAQTQQKDAETSGVASLDLKAKQEEIKRQEELVERLTKNSVGAAITASVSGTVRRVNCVAGSDTRPETSLLTIELTDLGYTLSFSVSNEQAQKARVGEPAELQYFWYGSASASLTAIKPDESDPSRRKTLVFTIEGDVTPGQELQLQMGARGQQYEIVVPNSAIREDNNGKFILKVTNKSSPLGTRYVAERVDVTVEVSDGTNSAVTGALMNSDFIITTATKPINPGDYVRIAAS